MALTKEEQEAKDRYLKAVKEGNPDTLKPGDIATISAGLRKAEEEKKKNSG